MSKSLSSFNAYNAAVRLLAGEAAHYSLASELGTIKAALTEFGAPSNDTVALRLVGLMEYRRGGELRMSDLPRFRKLLRTHAEWAEVDLIHKEAKAPRISKAEAAQNAADAKAKAKARAHYKDLLDSMLGKGLICEQDYERKLAEFDAE